MINKQFTVVRRRNVFFFLRRLLFFYSSEGRNRLNRVVTQSMFTANLHAFHTPMNSEFFEILSEKKSRIKRLYVVDTRSQRHNGLCSVETYDAGYGAYLILSNYNRNKPKYLKRTLNCYDLATESFRKITLVPERKEDV